VEVAVIVKPVVALHPAILAVTVIFAGQVITGGAGSKTVTVNSHELVFPHISVTVTATVVVPAGYWALPKIKLMVSSPLKGNVNGGLEIATWDRPTLEVASIGTFITPTHPGIESSPELTSIVIFCGQVITGGVGALTVTLEEQVDTRPHMSVAVIIICVVPMGKLNE
jgi:hypothetical protein